MLTRKRIYEKVISPPAEYDIVYHSYGFPLSYLLKTDSCIRLTRK